MGTTDIPLATSTSSTMDVATATAVGIGIGVVAGTILGRYLQVGSFSFSKASLASRPAYKPGQTPQVPSSAFGKKIHTFEPNKLSTAYHLMISTLTPRPIALVSSKNPTTGVDNVAPFSYFGCVGHDPPMVAIGFVRNRHGERKDSITNIVAAKEFSVQIMSEWYLDAANHSCGAFAPETDEYVESGMTKGPCDVVQAPRVKEAGVVYECQLVHVHTTKNANSGKDTVDIILAEVIRVHVDETLLVPDFDPMNPMVDTTKLKPMGRLGGDLYTTLGEIVDIPRPQV